MFNEEWSSMLELLLLLSEVQLPNNSKINANNICIQNADSLLNKRHLKSNSGSAIISVPLLSSPALLLLSWLLSSLSLLSSPSLCCQHRHSVAITFTLLSTPLLCGHHRHSAAMTITLLSSPSLCCYHSHVITITQLSSSSSTIISFTLLSSPSALITVHSLHHNSVVITVSCSSLYDHLSRCPCRESSLSLGDDLWTMGTFQMSVLPPLLIGCQFFTNYDSIRNCLSKFSAFVLPQVVILSPSVIIPYYCYSLTSNFQQINSYLSTSIIIFYQYLYNEYQLSFLIKLSFDQFLSFNW